MWADGWVCGTGDLFQKENKTVCDPVKTRRIPEAQKYRFEKVRPYLPLFTEHTAMGLPCPWLSVIKEGLKLRGVNAGVARKISGKPWNISENACRKVKSRHSTSTVGMNGPKAACLNRKFNTGWRTLMQ